MVGLYRALKRRLPRMVRGHAGSMPGWHVCFGCPRLKSRVRPVFPSFFN